VLQHLDEKLQHLPKGERVAIAELVRELSDIFPNVPCKDVGNARPIKQYPYRLNPSKLAILRKEVDYMLQYGIVEPSQSEWSSPCVMVPKADGSYHFCTDFRKVNAITTQVGFLPIA